MKKCIIKMVVVIAVFAIILPLASCFDGPWTDIRNAPYRSQIQDNYCAVACIQMWALFDGAEARIFRLSPFFPSQTKLQASLGSILISE
jgi:hypothetical protein